MNLDINKFIHEIEQRPAIWDMKCKEYRKEKVKQWEEIINMFTDENVSVEVKRKQAQLLQTRWKTLRDAFVKERRQLSSAKSGSAASNTKRYKYHKQLSFLLPVISNNTPPTHETVIKENKNSVKRPQESSMITLRPKKTKKIDPPDEIDTELTNVLKFTMQKNLQEDQDRQFMLSLSSDFKRVPDRLKSMVKINILKCIMEAQDELYDSHQVQRAERLQHTLCLYSNQQYEGYYTNPEELDDNRRPSYQISASFNQAHDRPRDNYFEPESIHNINREEQHEVQSSPKSVNTTLDSLNFHHCSIINKLRD